MPDRRHHDVPVAVERRSGHDRRVIGDRRSEGKRAGEYDLDPDTVEFIQAINQFKADTGRAFLTWSEVLGVVRELGYEKP